MFLLVLIFINSPIGLSDYYVPFKYLTWGLKKVHKHQFQHIPSSCRIGDTDCERRYEFWRLGYNAKNFSKKNAYVKNLVIGEFYLAYVNKTNKLYQKIMKKGTTF